MQVFIIGTALETAKELDGRRLNKQIIECGQILDAISGTGKGWFNHPITNMYRDHRRWLWYYKKCLESYQEYLRAGDGSAWGDHCLKEAEEYSRAASAVLPPFHCEDYFDQMKRRLYTKNPVFYAKWKDFGWSDVNWYFVDGHWVKYSNGKKLK